MQPLQADRTYCTAMSRTTSNASSSTSGYQATSHKSGWVSGTQNRWGCVFSVQEAWACGGAMLGNPSGAVARRFAQEETSSHVGWQSEVSLGSRIHQPGVCVSGNGTHVQPYFNNDGEAINTYASTNKTSGRVNPAAASTTSAVRAFNTRQTGFNTSGYGGPPNYTICSSGIARSARCTGQVRLQGEVATVLPSWSTTIQSGAWHIGPAVPAVAAVSRTSDG